MKKKLFITCLSLVGGLVSAQGLEDIIVEKYFVSDTGSAKYPDLVTPAGFVTYRIFVDLEEGCTLQAVYGNKEHPLFIESTTSIFNNLMFGSKTGDHMTYRWINQNTAPFDSYLTIGAATGRHLGVLKSEDWNGSIIVKRKSLEEADGLIEGDVPDVTVYALELEAFDQDSLPGIYVDNGAWACLEAVQGPTPENRILIAQVTTDGDLSFELNLQVGTPDCGILQFVARNPRKEEILFEGLSHGTGTGENKYLTRE